MRQAFCAALVLLASARLAFAGPLPRYDLPVGRVLEYEANSTSKENDGPESTSSLTRRLMVLAENPDGSRRVVVRTASTYNHSGMQADERISLSRVDLFPDGRAVLDDNAMPGSGIASLLPKLPDDASQSAGQWVQTDPTDQSTHTYRFKSDTDGQYVFTSESEGPMDRIHITTSATTMHFDRAKGLIVAIESTGSQDYGFHSKSTGTAKLTKVDTIEPARLEAMRKDYDTYFDAVKQYGSITGKSADQPENTEKFLTEGRLVLDKAAGSVSLDEVKQELARMLKSHDDSAKYELDSARQIAAVLNKPAADWTAKDLAGNEFSQKGLRGKVVVMDFWYRGCGWCMYAMPQVRQLAEDYKDKPVVFLGMNTDREQADAEFVIKEFDLKYPTLKATGIPEKFGVRGFPTMIIIDPQGVVRGCHIGYSPDLRKSVTKKIDELLKTPA